MFFLNTTGTADSRFLLKVKITSPAKSKHHFNEIFQHII